MHICRGLFYEEEEKVNRFGTKSQLLSLFTAVKMNNFVQTAFFFPKYQARKILQKQLSAINHDELYTLYST